jgi:chemotaxis signal transduction protein
MIQDDNVNNKYLVFGIGSGEGLYSMHTKNVKEIIKYDDSGLDYKNFYKNTILAGIVNLRGSVISVIDLRKILNLEADLNERSKIIVTDDRIGLLIGDVKDVAVLENYEEPIESNLFGSYKKYGKDKIALDLDYDKLKRHIGFSRK